MAALRRVPASDHIQPMIEGATITPQHREAASARLAVLALLLAAFAIGCSPIFVRLSDLGPTATAFYRTALGTPVLMLLARGEAAPVRRDWGLLVLAGFCFAGDLVSWHWAIKLTSVANATLLANLAPIVVTAGAFLLFGERITGGFLAALAGAVIGCAVLAGDRVSLASGIDGDGLALVTALFYGSYFLVLSRVRARVGTMLAMAVTAGSCSMFLLPAALVSGESMVPQSLHAWAILLGLALVSQVAGQTLIGWALKHLPASYSSVSLLLQPVVAASLAWLLLGERLGIFQVVGGMIILASIVAARRASR